MNVRTRVAPSPTGSPHLGTAYIALFNKAFAQKHQGEFVLRIEDSDAARSTAESEIEICQALRWLNLNWDEGPDKGGDYGPYRVSERLDIYKEHATDLVAANGAFYCFCSAERLDQVRQEQQKAGETTRYDGHCLGLTEDDVQRRLERGDEHVVRLKVPGEGSCEFIDQIRGEISIPWEQIDMQILLKSDGNPTYHLAAPVDDHLMGITHILRGEEWINSCPKHVLLYDYFGWEYQQLFHLPLLRNPDQSKMSKRKNPTGIVYYKDRGYLPEALLNYLATMGWSMPDESEKFSFDEFVGNLDLQRVSPRGPVFDHAKLDWLNGLYLRELPAEQTLERFLTWLNQDERVSSLAGMVRDRTERFDQVIPKLSYLLGERPDIDELSFSKLKTTQEDLLKILDFTLRTLEQVSDWSSESLQQALRSTAEFSGFKLRDFLSPLFIALSGQRVALPLFDSLQVLGREISQSRIRDAIDVLGGLSKKKLKRLEKEWQSTSRTSAVNS